MLPLLLLLLLTPLAAAEVAGLDEEEDEWLDAADAGRANLCSFSFFSLSSCCFLAAAASCLALAASAWMSSACMCAWWISKPFWCLMSRVKCPS